MTGRTRTSPIDVGNLIAGDAVPGVGVIERFDPTRPDELVGTAQLGDHLIAGHAITAAHDAKDDWAARSPEDRASALLAAADAIDAVVDELAPLLCRELGKVIADCHGEIGFASAYLRAAVRDADGMVGAREVVDDDAGRMEIRRVPHGVCAAVTPWNAPIILSLLKVAPALATGNTMVVKPSPLAPLTVTRVLGAIASHVPDGVLNVVHGGAEIGRVLTSDTRVAKVAFTGGLATGAAIMRNAADTVKPLVLELGGNDAAILLDDADLSEAAVERLIHASFITSGQVCMAAKRVYVHRSRHDELVEAYRRIADRVLVVGDPMDPRTTVGPMVDEANRDRVLDLVAGARERGAEVIHLGSVADDDLVATGWFLQPTLVLGADDADPVVADEQFGPIVPILPFDDVDEVVGRANASDLALGSSVWSADEERAFEVARRLEAGITFVNTHNRSGMSLRAPFGGRKLSGFGREYGRAGVEEYLLTHTINLPAGFRPGAEAGSGAGYPGADS